MASESEHCGFGEAEDGAIGFGDDARSVGGIVEELGGFAGELARRILWRRFAVSAT